MGLEKVRKRARGKEKMMRVCEVVIPIHCYSTITTRLGLGIAPRNDIKSGGGAWEADIFLSGKQK